MMLLYSLALTLGLTLASPWWLTRMVTTQRYREGLRQRLGFVPAALRQVAKSKKIIWLHAVSVGEVLAATRLAAELEAALGEGWRIVISTTTRTGQHLAKERFGAERVFYMPLDFAFAVRAYMRALQPHALILMESELWPRLLHECATRNIPVAVANARVSDRSFTRTLRLRKLWQLMARHITLFLAQSDLDAERLIALSSDKTPVRTTGNLKYDVRAPRSNRLADLIRDTAAGRPIIVAGSTVGGTKDSEPDEEGWLLTVWGGRARNQAKALLVIAPRHPERFGRVWDEASSEFPTVRATELLAGTEGTQFSFQVREPGDRSPEVVILNTVGDLASVYAIADVAFVGGSLIKRGGHNPLEPAQFGVPVIIGPSFENFRHIVSTMRAADGIVVIQGSPQLPTHRANGTLLHESVYKMRESLENELMRLLTGREAARTMGERGRQVFEQQQGATKRTVEAILTLLNTGGFPPPPGASE